MKNTFTLLLVALFLNPAFAQRNDNPEFYLRTKGKKLAVILKAADFKPGDRVADIGAGEGWLDAAIGIHHDSLSFYLEEIDSNFIKKSRLREALDAYGKVKGRPITCSYTTVIGTEKSTTLPESFFDKVLLIDTYHHLSYRDDMIRDMNHILKPGGKLIVFEPLARKPGDIYKSCHSRLYTSTEIISSFSALGFRHDATFKTVNSSGKQVRVFVFGKI